MQYEGANNNESKTVETEKSQALDQSITQNLTTL